MTKSEQRKAKKKIRKLRVKVADLRSVIHWCLDQDWSYGNHGPQGVSEALRDVLKRSRR